MQSDTSQLSLWDTTTATSCLASYTRQEIITAWPLPTLLYHSHSTRSSLINAAVALSAVNQAYLLDNLKAGRLGVTVATNIDGSVPSLWTVSSVTEELQTYTISQILLACDGLLHAGTRSRSQIMEAIAALSIEDQVHVRKSLSSVLPSKRQSDVALTGPSKRIRTNTEQIGERAFGLQNQEMRTTSLVADITQENMAVDWIPEFDNRFLYLHSEQQMDEGISNFLLCTGNDALATAVCASCAREVGAAEVVTYTPNGIPFRHHLRPSRPHPNHHLTDGMLLEPAGINAVGNATICDQCNHKLLRNTLPPLSLANNMWIGEIPWVLKVLSLPERLLIAKYYPVAYIVKLYPKDKRARYWKSEMASGLKGNVSTYRLDSEEIQNIIQGPFMPPPASILSSIIGVTFVGPNNVPSSLMPEMLYVRRNRVREALEWLKANNPLYHDMVISEERLSQLPETGIL